MIIESAYVICETWATITTHLRPIGPDFRPVRLGGHVLPKPKTLCDMEAAWDTKLPVATVRCRDCRAKAEM